MTHAGNSLFCWTTRGVKSGIRNFVATQYTAAKGEEIHTDQYGRKATDKAELNMYDNVNC